MTQNKMAILIVLFLLVIGVSSSVFTVKEWERAILFQFGEVVRTDYQPGLHFKIPIVNNVRKFDGRIMTLDAEPERYLTAEKKNLIVDAFVKWRINDIKQYYTAMGGDADRTNLRLSQIIKDGLRAEFGKRTIQEVVSGERKEVMEVLAVNTEAQARNFGIRVVDVRIKRIDLPEDISTSVYRRMEAERARVAKDLRSRGAEAAERIRADADRQRTVIVAEAYREAEQLRGEGDAKAADLYATAFKRDPEFFSFYRSINAYRDSFKDKDDVLLLSPDNDFFKYFKDVKGK
ncbi:MAG: protease modulator HflC [Gammaproteobacteria bacterium]|nr:protease modulator HflC [Gammaproteobacteria bacterium]